LKIGDKETLSAKYGLPRWELLTSWVRALNHVRNICAHHSRLWNRSPADQPKIPRPAELPLLDHLVGYKLGRTRLYATAAATQFLLRTTNPGSTWAQRLREHVATFPTGPGAVFGQSGFPEGWETLALWNGST